MPLFFFFYRCCFLPAKRMGEFGSPERYRRRGQTATLISRDITSSSRRDVPTNILRPAGLNEGQDTKL